MKGVRGEVVDFRLMEIDLVVYNSFSNPCSLYYDGNCDDNHK